MQVFLCFIFAAKNDIMIEERLIGDGDLIVQRYVDILTDAGFKAVFRDQRNKDVLNTPSGKRGRMRYQMRQFLLSLLNWTDSTSLWHSAKAYRRNGAIR